MRKIARRFQLQPSVEGLDYRIAPSSFAGSGDTPPSDSPPAPQPSDPPSTDPNAGDTSPTGIKVYPAPGAGGSGPTKP